MDTLVYVSHALAPLAAGLLFASAWQGLVLTAVAALAMRAFPKVSPRMRTRIWTAVLLLVVLLPVLEMSIPHAAASGGARLHFARDWSAGLLGLWVAVAMLRGVGLAANALRLWKLAERAVPVFPVPAAVAPLLEGRRRAVLCVSAGINRPSVAGFFSPRVLLPEGLLETMSAPELEHVVLHEMEHLRRWDDWMNLLQQVSLVLLPLNPALFWLDRRLCRERELACDDGVLQATKARKAYAACLVKLAEESMAWKGFALALSALGTRARESELVGRVRRILAGPEQVATAGQVRFALGALGLAVLGCVGVLARSPQWVSFDGASPTVAQAAEPRMPFPQAFPGRMVAASMRMGAAQPHLRSAVSERLWPRARPAIAFAMQPRRARVRTVRTWAGTGRPGTTMRLGSAISAARAWSTVPVSDSLRGTPQTMPAARTEMLPVARVIVTEFEVSQPIFAAVPVRGGWLILQL